MTSWDFMPDTPKNISSAMIKISRCHPYPSGSIPYVNIYIYDVVHVVYSYTRKNA